MHCFKCVSSSEENQHCSQTQGTLILNSSVGTELRRLWQEHITVFRESIWKIGVVYVLECRITFSILRLSQMQVQRAAVVGPSQLASEPEPKAPWKHAQGYTVYRNPSSAPVERKERVHLWRRRAGQDWDTLLNMCHMISTVSWMRIKYSRTSVLEIGFQEEAWLT